jgi:endonuclease-3 related protein
MPANTSKARVLSLYKRLFKHYGPQHWWPADSPWEMMVGAILTQNTSWTNVEKAITSLKNSKARPLRSMARVPRKRLEKLIRSSGYFRQKAHRLKGFARAVLKDPSLARDRGRLLAQHGIGPETADSILLYASGQPVFVIDAYTRRLGQRLGWFESNDYHGVQDFFHERLARDAALYNEYHALIVRHSKEFCTSRHPKCPECPVQVQCAFGRRKRS